MNIEKRTRDFSNTVYVFRVFAILSVIIAHVPLNSGELEENIWGLFQTIGVPGFFICAGYYFDNHVPLMAFWRRKLKTIIIPWLVVASITYAVIRLTTERTRFSYPEWVLGNGTPYYFVPMLLLCFLIFYFLRTNLSLILVMLVGIASQLLTAAGVIELTGFVDEFLDVFNWVFFFGLGALLGKNRQAWKVEGFAYSPWRWIMLSLAATMAIGTVYAVFFTVSFWSYLSVPYELAAVLTLFMLSGKLKDLRLLVSMGINTYVVYLFHIQLASRIKRSVSLPNGLYFLKPLLVLVICYALVYAVIFLAKKLKLDKFLWIVGIRTK